MLAVLGRLCCFMKGVQGNPCETNVGGSASLWQEQFSSQWHAPVKG